MRKRLHFVYTMQIDYEKEVSKCNFTIKCIPKSNQRQMISNLEIEITPPVRYSRGSDGLNNSYIYGVNDEAHRSFCYRLEGDAQTGFSDYDELYNDRTDMIFKFPHGLNVAGENIKKYYEEVIDGIPAGTLSRAAGIMSCLHRDFKYVTGRTDHNTTAEEAFSLGCGVCQDYAHIFIALLQLAGISARYVTGFLIGEGASHAWVEVLDDNKWFGFDPTNNTRVSDEHIKLGIGRDAKDCMINRGIMHGGGYHLQTINVSVTEV